ncbi:hypothetical protein ACFW04_013656 [Cataglyphis niger]
MNHAQLAKNFSRSLWVCLGLVARRRGRENPNQRQALNKVDIVMVDFTKLTCTTARAFRLGCIRGIAAYDKLFKCPTEPNSRAAIAVKGFEVLMPQFCFRDVSAIVMDLRRSNIGNTRKVMVKGLPLIVGCDANAHHIIWDSINVNDRGKVLEYLAATDLEILNRGVDFALCSRNLVPGIVGWHVSFKISLSDQEIIFRFANVRPEAIYRRNSRRTDWDSFREDLSTGLCDFSKKHRTDAEVELCMDHLQRALMGSFEKNCPARAVRSNKKVSGIRDCRGSGKGLGVE